MQRPANNTALKQLLFSRRNIAGDFTLEQDSRRSIIASTGLSRTHVTNAEKLAAADPHVLRLLRRGVLSQKLALRLLRSFPRDRLLVELVRAEGRSIERGRNRILPKDIWWARVTRGSLPTQHGLAGRAPTDLSKVRLALFGSLVTAMAQKPLGRVARNRIAQAFQVQKFLVGKLPFECLEAFLLGRTQFIQRDDLARGASSKAQAGITGRAGTRRFRRFKEARLFVRSLQIRSVSQWRLYCTSKLAGRPAMPADIPSDPFRVYRNHGWRGFGDFFGNGRSVPVQSGGARPFEEARKFVRRLGLKSSTEWKERYRFGLMPDKPTRPADIPSCPDITYKAHGWKGWPDFLSSAFPRNLRPD